MLAFCSMQTSCKQDSQAFFTMVTTILSKIGINWHGVRMRVERCVALVRKVSRYRLDILLGLRESLKVFDLRFFSTGSLGQNLWSIIHNNGMILSQIVKCSCLWYMNYNICHKLNTPSQHYELEVICVQIIPYFSIRLDDAEG